MQAVRICGFSAVLLVAFALVLPQAGARGLAVRHTTDQADDFSEPQVHFMYVIPSDGTDRELDINGTIAASVANFQGWLDTETGGKTLRVDTFGGAVDVTFLQLADDDATMAAYGVFLRDQLELRLHNAGFDATDKLYAVYYDGTNDAQVCGGGAWPPTLVGDTGAVYMPELYNGVNECYDPSLSLSGIQIMDYAILHEMIHTLGFVPQCAPNHTLSGHVSDSQFDLMYAGSQPWYPTYLDVNRNDYYDAGVSGCADLSTNGYLGTGRPTAVQVTQAVARPTRGAITITWGADSTAGFLGFHVWRTDMRTNRSVRLTLRLIPVFETPYSFVDRTARLGRSYTYGVEALALDGSRASVTRTAIVRRTSR